MTDADFKQFRAFRGLTAPHPPRVMLDGDRPQPYILAGLAVCILLVAAFLATEMQAFPVGCRNKSTFRATSGCVMRADDLRGNASSRSLILDFEPGISIRPPVHLGPQVLPLAERRVSNVAQILHDDSPCADRYRVADQCFGCGMNKMPCYGSLMPLCSN